MTQARDSFAAAQIRAGRALLAWSQQDLAKSAGIAASTIADFERNHRDPNAESLALMRAALERAGVRFTKGGAVLGAAIAPAPMRSRGGAPIRWIDSSDLIDWAQRRSGQDGMPELISRLIRASHGASADLSFPSGDSVQFGGWDGTCTVAGGYGPLPDGQSAWEMGTQRNGIRSKAEGDYLKRTSDPGIVDPSETTFVFATPQRWPGKRDWAAAKKSEGVWRDVRVVDNDDFVHWIELFPVVGHWLATKIGKRPVGIRELSEVWDQWSLATERPLSSELTLEGRDENAKAVLKWLRDPPSVMSVQAESVEEAIAFLHAAISELPAPYRDSYLSRSLVPSNDDLAISLSDAPSPLFIIMSSSPDGLPQSIAAKGHHVFVAFGSDVNAPPDVIKLARPRRSMVEQALINMGFDRAQANSLARDSGQSLTVLRRLLPPAPGQRPSWARSAPSRSFIAALLAGGWSESYEGDRAVLEQLAGHPYAQLVSELRPLLVGLDSPIRKSGDSWRVISPRDAWLLLAPYIHDDDVAAYFKAFDDIFREHDPRFEINPNDRWLAASQGALPSRSSLLRMGMLDTLIILALYGDRAEHVSDPSGKVDTQVTKLLRAAPPALWWSLQDAFRKLAEAAPSPFLRSVRTALSAPSTSLSVLFEEDTGGVSGAEHLSGLLWALEQLAWSPDFFAEVCNILAALDTIDPGGKWINRPANSLRHLFLLWNPQTYTSLADRLLVLDGLRTTYPAQAWKLLLGILPKGHDVANPTAHSQWRDFRVDRPEIITYALMAIGAKAISDRLCTDVGQEVCRWKQVLEVLGSFEPDVRVTLGANLLAALPKLEDPEERASLRSDLRRMLHQHRQFYPDAAWALPEDQLEAFQEAYDLLQPADIVDNFRWIFESGAAPARPYPGGWQKAREEGEKAQVVAAQEILQAVGTEGIIRLARSIESPGWLGRALNDTALPLEIRDYILELGFRSENERDWSLAHGLTVRGLQTGEGPTITDLVSRAVSNNWGPEAIIRILLAAPALSETWRLAETNGADVDDGYWNRVNVFYLPDHDVEQAAYKLLEVGRARHAVHYLGARLATKPDGELVARALREAINDEKAAHEEHNEGVMFVHNLGELLDYIENVPTVDRSTIVSLEWAYFRALQYSSRPARTLQKALSEDPLFFVQILRAIYMPSKESGVVEPEVEDFDAASRIASHGWSLLHNWTYVPGSDDAGVVDGETLTAWVSKARGLAAEIGRLEVCDGRIGDVLAASKADADGIWPPKGVRDLIERLASEDLESGIRTGLFNKRGVTVRMPDDGGGQERALAATYRKHSKTVSLDWPRTAALLDEIARMYELDAQREDEAVVHREWF